MSASERKNISDKTDSKLLTDFIAKLKPEPSYSELYNTDGAWAAVGSAALTFFSNNDSWPFGLGEHAELQLKELMIKLDVAGHKLDIHNYLSGENKKAELHKALSTIMTKSYSSFEKDDDVPQLNLRKS